MLVYLSILGALAAGATYMGGDTDDTVHGTEGDDSIDGGAGEDSIFGGLGDDLLDGGADNDWILGGSGDDTISGGSGNDFLAGDDGDDVIAGGSGFDTVYAGDGNDTLTSSGTRAELYGDEGEDWIEVTDAYVGSRIEGGEGNDVLLVRGDGDYVDMRGGAGSDILYSEHPPSRMTGGAGSDFFVLGGEDDDPLTSAAHLITDFSAGTDQLVVPLSEGQSPEDFWIEELNGAGGRFAQVLTTVEGGRIDVVATLLGADAEGVSGESLIFMDAADLDTFFASQDADGPALPDGATTGEDDGDEGEDTTWIEITQGDDLIELGIGDFGGEESINALGGSDTIVAEDGWDTLAGGTGDDLIVSGVEDSDRASGIYGSRLLGEEGDDTLVSQSVDWLVGGEGSDTFIVDQTARSIETGALRPLVEDFDPDEDRIVVTLPESVDPQTLIVSEDVRDGATVAIIELEHENSETTYLGSVADASMSEVYSALHYVHEDNLDAYIASNGATALTLNAVQSSDDPADEVEGGEGVVIVPDGVNAGNQVLDGTAFNDVIHAGFGDDVINGLGGDDRLIGDDGSDTIDGDAGRDTIYAGDGNDLVRVEGSVNEIIAGAGDDILWTTGGAIMTGGEGEDYFLAGSERTLVTDFNPAEDTIVLPFASDGTYTMGADPETGETQVLRDGTVILQLSGVAAGTIALSDIAMLDEEETYAFLNSQGAEGPSLPEPEQDPWGASEGDDALFGTGGGDLINGLGGSDTIDGDAGIDTVFGGSGNDLLRAEGSENLLSGGEGSDILWATGAATMTGGAGADFFLAGSDASVITDFDLEEDVLVVPFAGEGEYTLGSDPDTGDAQVLLNGDVILHLSGIAAGSVALSDVVFLSEAETYAFLNSQGAEGPSLPEPEVPVLPSEGDDSLIGTEFDDTINALGGNDTIDGGDGADRLEGGAGDDLIFAGAASEAGTIERGASNSLPLVQTAGDSIFGMEGDDTLVGDIANVLLSGGDGDDVLYGGEDGRQVLTGGTGNDTLVGGNGIYDLTSFGVGGIYSLGSGMIGGDGDDVIVNGSGYGINNPFNQRAGAFGGDGADVFIDPLGGSQLLSIGDFDDEDDTLILTVPDGTVLPEDGGLEFSYRNYVYHSRYMLVQSDLNVRVTDSEGVTHSGAKLTDFRDLRYYPGMPSTQVTSNPFDDGTIVVMTQSEAEAYWEPRPILS